ncbi:MAG: hypothetical protein JRE61_15040 [Deltaproteobacteria bacterium]|nr:hypothetical protein [Deltaproteobacteria bacterium]
MTQKPTYEDLMERVKELEKKVSGSRKVDAALRESEGILGGVLQSIGDHISLLDKNLNILWANETSRKIFGNNIVALAIISSAKNAMKLFIKEKFLVTHILALRLRPFRTGKFMSMRPK